MDGAEPQAADPEAADDEAPLPEGQFLVLLPGAAVVRRQPTHVARSIRITLRHGGLLCCGAGSP